MVWSVKRIFLVLALSGRVSPRNHLLWEIDWPTFQSTDGGSVPAGRELAPLQCIKDSSPPPIPLAPGLRRVSFMGDRALLSVPELLDCMPLRKDHLCPCRVLSSYCLVWRWSYNISESGTAMRSTACTARGSAYMLVLGSPRLASSGNWLGHQPPPMEMAAV